ncbi:MFS family permease [Kitasatospora sp. MAA19]|uniref:MFS transporter n=1 Tax=unclassified Kitasatospora TaxID=2633591 RepID=UPI00247535BC|nr:MFS transporter [Kitasatospora sp. MAA19]MDH6710688.1 MFS family permease [Kitasatospora sp. MAA19]
MEPTPLSRNRDFRLLWVGGLLASLGSQLASIALPLLVLRETGSAAQAGAIGTVSVGALLLTMLPGGVLADRIERRRLMRVCDVGSLLAVTALVIAVLRGHTPLPLVLLVAAAGALIASTYGPAAGGLLRAAVPREQVRAASSRMQARGAAARLIGPLGGGALFAWHPVLPFLAEGVGLLLSTICVALMRTRSVPAARSGAVFSRSELTAGLTFIWRQPYLRTLLLIFGLGMNFAFSALMFATLAVASDGGRSGVGGGTVVSCTAAGALAGALLAPKLDARARDGSLVALSCWAAAATAGVLVLTRVPVLIGLLCAVCMCLSTVASIGFVSGMLLAAPPDRIGRVQSAAGFLSTLVQPFGPLAGGALLGTLGGTRTFALLALGIALCAAVVTWAPPVRRGPAPVPAV